VIHSRISLLILINSGSYECIAGWDHQQFLMKVTGYSRPQLTRLVGQYKMTGKIEWKLCRNNGFAKKYSDKDIRLLAKTDQQHETPCGHTVKKLCE